MKIDNRLKHYLILIVIIALGTTLRFCQLELKPLWIDEVVTALFSLGLNYQDIPVEVTFPLSDVQNLFTFQPQVSYSEIINNLATQSTHPPLFFCLMHQWLDWLEPINQSLVWKIRAFPALIGVGAIAAIYYLNRLAFSSTAGLMGAAIMAMSPFGIYLSQEARHYTLPVLLITLALISLVVISKDLKQGKTRPIIWLTWSIINGISFYVHYFCILTFIAQAITLFLLVYQYQKLSKTEKDKLYCLLPISHYLIYCLLPLILFLPWLSTLIEHFTSPKTSWIPSPHNVAPIYQTLIAWLLMVITLPIEGQPIWIQISSGILMLSFGCWLGWKFWQGIQRLWQMPDTRSSVFTLLCFITFVLLQFLGIVYLLNKDLTIAPRYNFIFYPAICALLGASLVNNKAVKRKKLPINNSPFKILAVGFLSCIFVAFNLAFHKPYHPQTVAQNFNQSSNPVMVVVGYNDSLDLALGLSYALALDKIREKYQETTIAFLYRNINHASSYKLVWQKLSKFPLLSLNLWMVAPGLKQKGYPQRLNLANETICLLNPKHHYRVGISYQLYNCQEKEEDI